jgi:hypothetical protein
VDDICRQVQRQLLRNESARFYHHRTRTCIVQEFAFFASVLADG